MNHLRPRRLLLLALPLLSASGRAAHALPPPLALVQDERPAEWPKLAESDRSKKDVDRLRRASTPEMGQQAKSALIADGAGVVPLLLPAYEKEKDPAALGRIREVLDAVTAAEHSKLVAREFEHRATIVRTWALARAASFADRDLLAAAEKALEGARARGEKGDAEELYAAALCATATGSLAGIDLIEQRAGAKWKQCGEEIRAALKSVQGPEASKRLAGGLQAADREGRVTLLRMLSACGDKSVTGAVRPFLDQSDNQLRVEAINALRGIVDGAPPIADLPVFEAIEQAKQWKARLGGGK